jgi:phosphoribosylglycinamide formyltransferase 1
MAIDLQASAVTRNIVILISGRGSNMEALVNAAAAGDWAGRYNACIAAVISNRPQAAGLAFAAQHGIASVAVDHTTFSVRTEFDTALAVEINRFSPTLVLLAGFMRIMSPEFVAQFEGRLLNIHPSLLPAFPGIRTHEQALAAGVRVHGATVHRVTAGLDCGPILAQAAVPVLPGDDAASLGARVLAQEHVLYPQVVSDLLANYISGAESISS